MNCRTLYLFSVSKEPLEGEYFLNSCYCSHEISFILILYYDSWITHSNHSNFINASLSSGTVAQSGHLYFQTPPVTEFTTL